MKNAKDIKEVYEDEQVVNFKELASGYGYEVDNPYFIEENGDLKLHVT